MRGGGGENRLLGDGGVHRAATRQPGLRRGGAARPARGGRVVRRRGKRGRMAAPGLGRVMPRGGGGGLGVEAVRRPEAVLAADAEGVEARDGGVLAVALMWGHGAVAVVAVPTGGPPVRGVHSVGRHRRRVLQRRQDKVGVA